MTVVVLSVLVICLLVVNIALWKFGFVHDAETPHAVLDKPVQDPKTQKAILKRLSRWKEEGKLTRAEFEHIEELCRSEW